MGGSSKETLDTNVISSKVAKANLAHSWGKIPFPNGRGLYGGNKWRVIRITTPSIPESPSSQIRWSDPEPEWIRLTKRKRVLEPLRKKPPRCRKQNQPTTVFYGGFQQSEVVDHWGLLDENSLKKVFIAWEPTFSFICSGFFHPYL